MNKRSFLKQLSTAALGAVAAPVLALDSKPKAVKTLFENNKLSRRQNHLPNVPLVTHECIKVKFYDDLIKNKTVMINFMYATCADICPGMTANLKQVHRHLGGRVGKDIFMYSITLEPEHDTKERLKAYTDLFHIPEGWTFLTGNKSDIGLLRKSLSFSFSDPLRDKDRTQHIGVVKFGIEPLGRWSMSPALGNPKYIAQYLRWMEPNGSRPNLKEILG